MLSDHLRSDGHKHRRPQMLPTAEAAAIGRPTTLEISTSSQYLGLGTGSLHKGVEPDPYALSLQMPLAESRLRLVQLRQDPACSLQQDDFDFLRHHFPVDLRRLPDECVLSRHLVPASLA